MSGVGQTGTGSSGETFRGGYVVGGEHVGLADVVCREGVVVEVAPGAAARHPHARTVDAAGELVRPGQRPYALLRHPVSPRRCRPAP